MNFKEQEIQRNLNLIKSTNIFEGSEKSSESDKILADNVKNLYQPIRESSQQYFKNNNIEWWSGKVPGNYLSSQVACINHLFPIRTDKNAVLSIVQNIDSNFDDVYIIPGDNGWDAYISFEVVSQKQHLNEGKLSRGAKCTSVDALIYAHHKNGKKYILPIEWKYTETYSEKDETNATRLKRYKDLINSSKELNCLENYEHSIYFIEPFFQLMRQTLWAEQLILHKDEELVKADDYLHLHIISSGNAELKNKEYKISNKSLKDTWQGQLVNPNKYKIISPEDFLKPIEDKYLELINYLEQRYW